MSTRHRTSWRTRAGAVTAGLALVASGLAGVVAASPATAAKPSVPDTLALAGPLAQQTITWETGENCWFSRDIDYTVREQLEAWKNLSCATVTVPQDWKNPSNGKTFKIRISRVNNLPQSSPDYKGTILVNPGGPGGDGIHWAPNIFRRGPELAKHFNAIGIDPRGVGQSERPKCMVDVRSDIGFRDLAVTVGETCSKVEPATKITTEQTAYDFDFVRGLIEVPKITYIGYSYGTWLAPGTGRSSARTSTGRSSTRRSTRR